MAQLSERLKAIIDANVPPEMRSYMYRMVAKEGASGKDSPTGARGPLQFTKGTGAAYGLVGPRGDIRGNEEANIRAGVKLTTDNASILRRHLGREPSLSELALAHQQGADTAGKMLTGAGNAPAKNLAVNKVDPNLPPQAAAEKIMNYYGFDKKPGITLTSQGMFDPNAPGAFAAPTPGAVPYAGGFTPPPSTTLTSNPVDIATAAGAAPATFAQRLLQPGNDNKGTVGGDALAAAGQLAKGIRPTTPAAGASDLNTIIPTTGTAVDQRIAGTQPLAQNMLTAMIQNMMQRRGGR